MADGTSTSNAGAGPPLAGPAPKFTLVVQTSASGLQAAIAAGRIEAEGIADVDLTCVSQVVAVDLSAAEHPVRPGTWSMPKDLRLNGMVRNTVAFSKPPSEPASEPNDVPSAAYQVVGSNIGVTGFDGTPNTHFHRFANESLAVAICNNHASGVFVASFRTSAIRSFTPGIAPRRVICDVLMPAPVVAADAVESIAWVVDEALTVKVHFDGANIGRLDLASKIKPESSVLGITVLGSGNRAVLLFREGKSARVHAITLEVDMAAADPDGSVSADGRSRCLGSQRSDVLLGQGVIGVFVKNKGTPAIELAVVRTGSDAVERWTLPEPNRRAYLREVDFGDVTAVRFPSGITIDGAGTLYIPAVVGKQTVTVLLAQKCIPKKILLMCRPFLSKEDEVFSAAVVMGPNPFGFLDHMPPLVHARIAAAEIRAAASTAELVAWERRSTLGNIGGSVHCDAILAAAEAKIKALKAEKDGLVDAHRVELAALKEKADAADDARVALATEIVELTATFQATATVTPAEIQQLQNDLLAHKVEVKNVREEVMASTAENAKLKKQISLAQRARVSAETAAGISKSDAASARTELRKATSRIAGLEKSLAAARADTADGRREIRGLEAKIKAARALTPEAVDKRIQAKLDTVQAEHDEAMAELRRRRDAEITGLQAKNAAELATSKAMYTELETVRAALEAMERRATAAEQAAADIGAHHAAELETARAELETVRAELETVRAERESMEHRVATAEAVRDAVSAQLVGAGKPSPSPETVPAADADVDAYLKQIAGLEDSNAEHLAKISGFEEAMAEANRMLVATRADLVAKDRTVTELRGHLDRQADMKQYLQGLEESYRKLKNSNVMLSSMYGQMRTMWETGTAPDGTPIDDLMVPIEQYKAHIAQLQAQVADLTKPEPARAALLPPPTAPAAPAAPAALTPPQSA